MDKGKSKSDAESSVRRKTSVGMVLLCLAVIVSNNIVNAIDLEQRHKSANGLHHTMPSLEANIDLNPKWIPVESGERMPMNLLKRKTEYTLKNWQEPEGRTHLPSKFYMKENLRLVVIKAVTCEFPTSVTHNGRISKSVLEGSNISQYQSLLLAKQRLSFCRESFIGNGFKKIDDHARFIWKHNVSSDIAIHVDNALAGGGDVLKLDVFFITDTNVMITSSYGYLFAHLRALDYPSSQMPYILAPARAIPEEVLLLYKYQMLELEIAVPNSTIKAKQIVANRFFLTVLSFFLTIEFALTVMLGIWLFRRFGARLLYTRSINIAGIVRFGRPLAWAVTRLLVCLLSLEAAIAPAAARQFAPLKQEASPKPAKPPMVPAPASSEDMAMPSRHTPSMGPMPTSSKDPVNPDAADHYQHVDFNYSFPHFPHP